MTTTLPAQLPAARVKPRKAKVIKQSSLICERCGDRGSNIATVVRVVSASGARMLVHRVCRNPGDVDVSE